MNNNNEIEKLLRILSSKEENLREYENIYYSARFDSKYKTIVECLRKEIKEANDAVKAANIALTSEIT